MVRPGYKQTEVGVIPEDWEVVRLGEVAALYQPVTIGARDLVMAGYPVLGAYGQIGFYHSKIHSTPQVIVTCRGSMCGTVNMTPGECWITGNAMVVNVDESTRVQRYRQEVWIA